MITGNGSWGSAIDFIQRYAGAVYNGHGYVPQIPTYVEELQARMEPYYLRRTIEDVKFDLPALSRNIVEASWEDARLGVQTKKKHGVLLRRHLAQISVALREGRISHDVLSVLSNLRVQTSMAKVPATVEMVQELRAAGENIVVFTWTVDAANAIARALETTRNDADLLGPPTAAQVCTGDVSQLKRDEMVASFQEHGGILVATYATLSEGVTLTKARFVVLHDLDWTPSTIEQAEKRIHRIGQNNACVSTWIVLRDSVDELLARVLEWKLTLNAEMIQNPNSGLLAMTSQVAAQQSFEDDFAQMMHQWVSGGVS